MEDVSEEEIFGMDDFKLSTGEGAVELTSVLGNLNPDPALASPSISSTSSVAMSLDVTTYVDPSPVVVYEHTSTNRVLDLFQSLGLNAVLVITAKGRLAGVIKKIDMLVSGWVCEVVSILEIS